MLEGGMEQRREEPVLEAEHQELQQVLFVSRAAGCTPSLKCPKSLVTFANTDGNF